MDDKICYVVGAGTNYILDFSVKDVDLVIGVDGGFKYLIENKIAVDLLVGDFDSLFFTDGLPCKEIIQLDSEKDDTDMLVAVKEGIKRGYKNFRIYCGTGGRFDHTLANIQILTFLSQNNMRGYLVDKNCIVTSVTNSDIIFNNKHKGFVSVFSYTDVSYGVYIEGMKYNLENFVLTNTFPLGVSNEFLGINSKVIVKKGTLLIVFPR